MSTAMREPTPGQGFEAVGIFDGGHMVGGGLVFFSLEDNLDKAFVFPAVEPDLRRRGIGGALLKGLVEHARGLGRSELMSGTSIPFAERESSYLFGFAAAHGFTPANTEVVRMLKLPVPDALLDEVDGEA